MTGVFSANDTFFHFPFEMYISSVGMTEACCIVAYNDVL